MAEHTPGPWEAIASHPSEGFDCFWIKAQLNPISRAKEIGTVNGSQNNDEHCANARLITASPDMLKALIAAEKLYQDGILATPIEEIDRVHTLRRTAIAKATGQ